VFSRESAIEGLRGCLIPQPTLFNDDLSLNLQGMREHVRFLLGHGLRKGNATLLVCGGAGEFPVLTLEERKAIAEAVAEAAAGQIPIILGVQTTSTLQAVELARHAESLAVAAIQVSPPFYYPPTDGDVIEWFRAIAEAAPNTGMVVYNTYWLGYNLSLSLIERLYAEIPQVVALKWSAPGTFQYQDAFLRFRGRLGIIDNHIMPVFNQMMGGIGINVHLGVFYPEYALRLWELLEARRWDEAQAEVNRAWLPYYRLLTEDVAPYTSGEALVDKLGLAWRGLPGGPNRPPTRQLTPELKEKAWQFFRAIGLPRA
jgi:4-hydroxy-tetrahydrodipicolinate synthase